ncbi:MAG: histidinol phosphate phosphatase domain-containing protein [Halobacteriota archaeon]|nr:histidinol phosphate phosphatase domain-containing protein [Halobacteriota archaeon]
MFDFHTHTIFSDGELIPSELVRRAFVIGYSGIALTDHVDFSNLDHVQSSVRKAKVLQEDLDMFVIVGVEITHVPPSRISELARRAKKAGAEIVVVHGETVCEPVASGTNRAALESPDVDILAHPGIITIEEAELARENGIFLEITSRKGHNTTNGHVVKVAREAGASLIVNTDSHSPDDLITDGFALKVAIGAGLYEEDAEVVLRKNPLELKERIGL